MTKMLSDKHFEPPPWWKEADGLFADVMDYVSYHAKQSVVDGIACMLHNKGYSLEGNTQESDFRWFTRELWIRAHSLKSPRDFEALPAEERERWERIACAAMDAVPQLMERVSHRCILHSQVFRNMQRAMRADAPK